MTRTSGMRASSFIFVMFVSSLILASPASANESSTTVVPTVPVAIAPEFESAAGIPTGLTPKLTPNVGIVDPSTKSAPEVITSTVTRPSVQATTPVVVPNRQNNETRDDSKVVKPIVQAPQLGNPVNEVTVESVEVTRVTPQLIMEAPKTENNDSVSPTVTTAEPAEILNLITPEFSDNGPDAVWSYLAYGAIGAFVALYAYRINVRRTHSVS